MPIVNNRNIKASGIQGILVDDDDDGERVIELLSKSTFGILKL